MNKITRNLNLRRLLGRVIGPRVLVASVPKAGTNLLTHTLSLIPELRLADLKLVGYSLEEHISRLKLLKRGQVATMHYGPWEDLNRLLDQMDFKVLFILRDPRDICVSFMYWVTYKDKQNLYNPYFASLPNDDARVTATIIGMEDEAKKPGAWLDDIALEVNKRLDWRSHPHCHTLTFESLVGSKGGGDDRKQHKTLVQIAKHLNLKLTNHQIQLISDHMFTETTTFRRGQIGDWVNHFNPNHKKLFKNLAGQLLIDLGYEKDFNW